MLSTIFRWPTNKNTIPLSHYPTTLLGSCPSIPSSPKRVAGTCKVFLPPSLHVLYPTIIPTSASIPLVLSVCPSYLAGLPSTVYRTPSTVVSPLRLSLTFGWALFHHWLMKAAHISSTSWRTVLATPSLPLNAFRSLTTCITLSTT